MMRQNINKLNRINTPEAIDNLVSAIKRLKEHYRVVNNPVDHDKKHLYIVIQELLNELNYSFEQEYSLEKTIEFCYNQKAKEQKKLIEVSKELDWYRKEIPATQLKLAVRRANKLVDNMAKLKRESEQKFGKKLNALRATNKQLLKKVAELKTALKNVNKNESDAWLQMLPNAQPLSPADQAYRNELIKQQQAGTSALNMNTGEVQMWDSKSNQWKPFNL